MTRADAERARHQLRVLIEIVEVLRDALEAEPGAEGEPCPEALLLLCRGVEAQAAGVTRALGGSRVQ